MKSKADIAAYIEACLEEVPEDAALFAAALGDVARASDMGELAKATD